MIFAELAVNRIGFALAESAVLAHGAVAVAIAGYDAYAGLASHLFTFIVILPMRQWRTW